MTTAKPKKEPKTAVTSELLLLLRKNGVKSYEDSRLGIKIEFGDRAQFEEPLIKLDLTPDIVERAKSREPSDPDDDLFYSTPSYGANKRGT